MNSFYLVQILSILYAACSVGQERNRNLLNREYVPPSKWMNKWDHIFGAAMTFLFCLGFALLVTKFENGVSGLLTFVLSGTTYWLLFMVGNNLATYDWDWDMIDYLGAEGTDNLIARIFGKRHGGKAWIVILLSIIAVSHILYWKTSATSVHRTDSAISSPTVIFVTDPEPCKLNPYGRLARSINSGFWYGRRIPGTHYTREVKNRQA
jgi:hypothetical protein